MSQSFTSLLNWPLLSELYNDSRYGMFRISLPEQGLIALLVNVLSLAIPVMMLQVYDRIIPHQSYDTLVMLTIGVIVALILDAGLRLIRARLIGWSSVSHEYALNCAALSRFCETESDAFTKNGAGEQLQNMNAIGRLREFFSGQALTAFIDLPFATLFLLLIAYLGGVLVFVPLALIVAFFVYANIASNQLKQALEDRETMNDKKINFVVSVLSGMHTVKSMGMEAFLQRRFEHAQEPVTLDNYRVALASGFAVNLSAVFGQLSFILTATAGCIMVLQGTLSVGGLSACTLLAGRAIQPVQRVLGTWLRLQDITLARQQVQSIFALPVRDTQEDISLSYPGHPVVLDNVSYVSAGHDTYLLNNISLTVSPGEVIAISGDKSSGKSTLMHLLAGFLKPTEGTITMDGLVPSAHSMADLITHIGYLPQEGTIFKGSILDNMTGFRNDAESIELARTIGEELNLDKAINLLPHGYQTMLNDTTADPIPPGIKQRIALTRVLMHAPSILLFDDADRALDKDGYNGLFRLLGRLKGSCTIIMVSQDRNLLCFADQFYRLENGALKRVTPPSATNLSLLSQTTRSVS